MKRLAFFTLILALVGLTVIAFPAQAQPDSPPLSPDNLENITLLNQMGSGFLPAEARLTWSHDGQYLFVPRSTGLELYSSQDWSATTLPTLESPAISAALSPDGQFVAIGQQNAQTALYALDNPTAPMTVVRHPDETRPVTQVAFSPDGLYLYTFGGVAFNELQLNIWQSGDTGWTDATLQNTITVEGYSRQYLTPTHFFYADSSFEENSGLLYMWTLPDATRTIPGENMPDKIEDMVYDPESNLLATLDISNDGHLIHLWDLTTDPPTRLAGDVDIPGEERQIDSMGFTPDGELFTASFGFFGSRIHHRDLSSVRTDGAGSFTETYNERVADYERFYRVQVNPTQNVFLAQYANGLTGEDLWQVRDLETLEVLLEIPYDANGGLFARGMHFSSDGTTLTLYGGPQTLQFDTTQPNAAPVPMQSDNAIRFMHTLPDGGTIINTTRYDAQGQVLVNYDVDINPSLYALDVSANGELLACASSNQIIVLDVASGEMVQTLDQGAVGSINILAFSPDGQSLVYGSYGEMTFIPLADGTLNKITLPVSERIEALEYSPDGALLVGILENGLAFVWDVESLYMGLNRDVARFPAGHPALAFSPDGSLLATGLPGGGLALRRVDGLRNAPDYSLPNFNSRVDVVAFSPDGSRLYTYSRSQGVVLAWGIE